MHEMTRYDLFMDLPPRQDEILKFRALMIIVDHAQGEEEALRMALIARRVDYALQEKSSIFTGRATL